MFLLDGYFMLRYMYKYKFIYKYETSYGSMDCSFQINELFTILMIFNR